MLKTFRGTRPALPTLVGSDALYIGYVTLVRLGSHLGKRTAQSCQKSCRIHNTLETCSMKSIADAIYISQEGHSL